MSEEKKDSFKNKITDLMLNWKVWILIFFLIISFFALHPQFDENYVIINGVTPNSLAENSGISFNSNLGTTNYEKVTFLNTQKILSEEDYYSYLKTITPNSTLVIRTNQNPTGYTINTGDFQNEFNSNTLGLSIQKIPKTNIRLGIELEGGSRLILKPTQNLTDNQYTLLVNNLQSRLDVYGASGTKVNKLEDAFSNEKYVIVESINSNKNDIFELIKRQGNFEARIANQTAFTGENIIRILNDPSHEIFQGCGESQSGFTCSYAFSMEIDSEGGDQFFDITKNLNSNGNYLSEKIFFYLDDKEITSLNIASSFKYSKVTNPQITVSGNTFPTEAQAIESVKKEMKFMQAILSTQSLPSELEVVQSYSISSSLGKTLLDNAIVVGLVSLLLVSSIISLRYRKWPVFIGILIALAGEIIIVFGIAAFMKLSIDLAAIGGIIAAIGTGVDDQIIITDEYFRKRKKNLTSRKKIKTALYIIMIAYLTTLAAMVPLYFAGLQLIKGFAFMIIVGITVGVFITRPAYATYLRIIMTQREERQKEKEEEN